MKMESLAPNLFVKDIQASIKFYELLGFQLVNTVPEEEKGESESGLVWAMMICGNVRIMFQTIESLGDSFPQVSRHFDTSYGDTSHVDNAHADVLHEDVLHGGGSLLFYIKLKNIRSFFERIKNKVTIVQGLEKTFYGATEFSIADNNNYILTFAEDEKE